MATAPVPVPEKKSNLLWWILGLLVGGVAVLGLGGLFIAGYILKGVRVQETPGQVEISTPVGGMKVSKDQNADPGLPVYPGAGVADAGATVELVAPGGETLAVTAAHYRTVDSLETVDEWYREKLGKEFTREGPGVMVRKRGIVGVSVKSSDIAYVAEGDDTLRIVVLERKGGRTEIALARVGKQEGQ